MEIDPRVSKAVRGRLGSAYDELLGAMLDLDVPPIYLFVDDRARLVRARDKAASAILAWAAAEPSDVAELASLLPDPLQVDRHEVALLEGGTWRDYFDLPMTVFSSPSADSPAWRAVPELAARLDDDGLIDIAGMDARPHGVLTRRYSLQYHQLLRRGFRSNIHYGLVAELLGARERYGCKTRLAIDERRVRLRSEYLELFEHDYWYGPPLNADVLDDLHALGETVHGDPEGGGSLLNPYVALSVRWTAKDRLKIVEIEEQVPVGSDGDGPLVLARYLHAIRDTDAHVFVHCDGAVKAFERSSYPQTPAEFAERGRGVHYRKVFRLDGSIPTETWSAVASQWFRGNRLILEYLSSLSGSSRSTTGDLPLGATERADS